MFPCHRVITESVRSGTQFTSEANTEACEADLLLVGSNTRRLYYSQEKKNILKLGHSSSFVTQSRLKRFFKEMICRVKDSAFDASTFGCEPLGRTIYFTDMFYALMKVSQLSRQSRQ